MERTPPGRGLPRQPEERSQWVCSLGCLFTLFARCEPSFGNERSSTATFVLQAFSTFGRDSAPWVSFNAIFNKPLTRMTADGTRKKGWQPGAVIPDPM